MKFITILRSRLNRKRETAKWVDLRKKQCDVCNWNTLRLEKLHFKVWCLKKISDFYTWITLNEKTDWGTCGHPECGCDLYYKLVEEDETCPENKWKSIYIPNSNLPQK